MNCIFTSCINEMHKMNRLLVLICATPLVSTAPHLVLSYYNEPREEVVQSISRIQNALGTPLDVFMYCKNETCPDIEGAHEAQDGDQNLGVQLAALERAPVKVGQEA